MFVKRTWYRKFVGIQLCNSLRYQIYLSDSLNGNQSFRFRYYNYYYNMWREKKEAKQTAASALKMSAINFIRKTAKFQKWFLLRQRLISWLILKLCLVCREVLQHRRSDGGRRGSLPVCGLLPGRKHRQPDPCERASEKARYFHKLWSYHFSLLCPSSGCLCTGFYRAMRHEPVTFGEVGGNSHATYVGWYECGTPIPGKWWDPTELPSNEEKTHQLET